MFMKKQQQQRVETIIGSGTIFKGEINSNGTVRIDGVFEGTINADWVIIGEGGSVKGDINSRGVVVGGNVEGNIKAAEIVEMHHKAQVFGDIFTAKLSISEGAIFEGRSYMQKQGKNEV